MKFFDYVHIALKNLSRQRARTILTIIAIVIGAISIIIMVSLVVSAKRVLISQLESIGAFTLVTVTGNPDMEGGDGLLTTGNGDNSDGKKLDDTVFADLLKTENVIAGTPVASVWAKSMKLEGQDKKTWPNVMGYEVDSNVFDTPVISGRALKKGDMDKIVVSADSLRTFGYEDKPEDVVGKNMILMLDGYSSPDWGPLPEKPPQNADKDWYDEQGKKTKEIKAEIVGVSGGGISGSASYISMDWARKLQTQVRWDWDKEAQEKYEKEQNGKDQKNNKEDYPNFQKIFKEDMIEKNGYGSIILKADNTNNVKKVGEEIKKQGYGVTTAEDMLEEIGKIFTVLGILAGVIGGIALFVATIGIVNTMIMATYERTREIGVMRACGARKKTIRRLFTFEAALLGFFGGIVGLLLSYGLAKIGNIVAGKIAVSESVPIENFIIFPLWLILGVIAFTTLVGLLAGLYPAHRAAKLDPVDALRYE